MTVSATQQAAHADYRRLLKAKKNAEAEAAWLRSFDEAKRNGWTKWQFIVWCHTVEGR